MKPSFDEWSEPHEEQEPTRRRIQRKGVGILEMEYYQDEMVMYCPMCKKAGFQVKLTNKILMPGEERQPDYDQFLECPDCREVIAAYVVEHDATIIRDDIPTVETPFENTTEIMGVLPKRTSKAGKRDIAKRNREKNRPHHKDPEIQRELDKGNIVNILYDKSR